MAGIHVQLSANTKEIIIGDTVFNCLIYLNLTDARKQWNTHVKLSDIHYSHCLISIREICSTLSIVKYKGILLEWLNLKQYSNFIGSLFIYLRPSIATVCWNHLLCVHWDVVGPTSRSWSYLEYLGRVLWLLVLGVFFQMFRKFFLH